MNSLKSNEDTIDGYGVFFSHNNNTTRATSDTRLDLEVVDQFINKIFMVSHPSFLRARMEGW